MGWHGKIKEDRCECVNKMFVLGQFGNCEKKLFAGTKKMRNPVERVEFPRRLHSTDPVTDWRDLLREI